MKLSMFKDEKQLISEAVDILIKELGPVEAGRFLSLQKNRKIESLKRHHKWQAELEKDEFFERVFGK